jgi:hypothetical protein
MSTDEVKADRFVGEVLSIDRHGDVTVRHGDRLVVIPADEAERAGVRFAPGDRITFRVDAKAAALARGREPALAE